MLDKDDKPIKWRRRIKELRVRLKMTQEDFAQAVGVRWITVARWEKKRSASNPSRLAQEKIREFEGRKK